MEPLIASLVEQAPSIVLAVLFALFAIALIRLHAENSKSIMAAWQGWLGEQNTKRDEEQKDRDQSCRDFLKEQREQSTRRWGGWRKRSSFPHMRGVNRRRLLIYFSAREAALRRRG